MIVNDHNAYAHTLAMCYVAADAERVLAEARARVAELNEVARAAGTDRAGPRSAAGGGWFTGAFCRRSRYFRPENGRRIEAVREAIGAMSIGPELRAVLLTALMEAADRVDSTTGVQMAYLKRWAPRAFNPLELRVPDVLPRAACGRGEAHALDALEAARAFEADVAYLDPPYNQHSYLGNYHVWETLVRWDRPELYGTACKRVDVRARRSRFNSRPRFGPAFEALLDAVRAPTLIVSFSDEGFLARGEVEAMLAARGAVRAVAHDYRRYVGAQIGIYNPRGERVGRVSHLRNTEVLYVVDRVRPRASRPRNGARRAPPVIAGARAPTRSGR